MKRRIKHWKWLDEKDNASTTFCGKKPYSLSIALHLKDVTCKQCQKVYKKCERNGYFG